MWYSRSGQAKPTERQRLLAAGLPFRCQRPRACAYSAPGRTCSGASLCRVIATSPIPIHAAKAPQCGAFFLVGSGCRRTASARPRARANPRVLDCKPVLTLVAALAAYLVAAQTRPGSRIYPYRPSRIWLSFLRPREPDGIDTLLPYSFHRPVSASSIGPSPCAFCVISHTTRGGALARRYGPS